MTALWIGLALVALAAVGIALAGEWIRRSLRRARNDHSRRPSLWNRFYSVDWGETATNNYGFAPATGDDPQRFQHQMYRELLVRLQGLRPLAPGTALLEVSCGRGGGLAAFLDAAPADTFHAVGLDVASAAIAFCRRKHGEHAGLRFVEGSALALPFKDGSFDVVLNVEASNDYADRQQFFREVSRVLKPGGVFLYADTCRDGRRRIREEELHGAGLRGEFEDISANVAEACRMDSQRRQELIRRHVPLPARLAVGRQLRNYMAVEGSKKLKQFRDGRRTYLMTAAVKV